MKKVFAVALGIMLLCLGGVAQANITIETVAVGDPGNASDTLTGYGSVGYDYNIGKYEVTAGQYTAFLNAKAANDPYKLYSTGMVSNIGCQIQRSGGDGSYTYSVAADWANRPVNYVSYWDSCRFANWLNNGQGSGDTETGAYTLTADGIGNNTVTRNADAKWAIPSEDEWYKAAYYKGGSANAGYYLYPTGSDTAPGRDIADASGNNANYSLSIGRPYYRTNVGEFENSASAYGTYDQGGNVFERNEALWSSSARCVRGGSFMTDAVYLPSSYRMDMSVTTDIAIVGFRVVSLQPVPEPSSFIAGAALVMPLLALRRLRGK